jgi:hypothetical protein
MIADFLAIAVRGLAIIGRYFSVNLRSICGRFFFVNLRSKPQILIKKFKNKIKQNNCGGAASFWWRRSHNAMQLRLRRLGDYQFVLIFRLVLQYRVGAAAHQNSTLSQANMK